VIATIIDRTLICDQLSQIRLRADTLVAVETCATWRSAPASMPGNRWSNCSGTAQVVIAAITEWPAALDQGSVVRDNGA
jgi:hypothetical protein